MDFELIQRALPILLMGAGGNNRNYCIQRSNRFLLVSLLELPVYRSLKYYE